MITKPQLLRKTGLTPRAFDWLRSLGLIPGPVRLERRGRGTQAFYPPQALARIREVQRLQREGFSLPEIREKLGPATPEPPRSRAEFVERALEEFRVRKGRLANPEEHRRLAWNIDPVLSLKILGPAELWGRVEADPALFERLFERRVEEVVEAAERIFKRTERGRRQPGEEQPTHRASGKLQPTRPRARSRAPRRPSRRSRGNRTSRGGEGEDGEDAAQVKVAASSTPRTAGTARGVCFSSPGSGRWVPAPGSDPGLTRNQIQIVAVAKLEFGAKVLEVRREQQVL